MRDFLRRFLIRNVDYSTRHNFKARLHSTDFRFLGAVVVFVVALFLVMRYA